MPENPRQDYSGELQFAKDLAQRAGKLVMEFYGDDDLDVQTKRDDSPVTIADETVNQLVIDAIKERYPEHGVLGEEKSIHLERSVQWVCDPLDGTATFLSGKPEFMFSLALMVDGKPVVATTLNPVTGDLFWATAGGGAFKNDGQSLSVSDRTDNLRLVFPTNDKILLAYNDLYSALTARAAETEKIHSTVFKGMLIAEGLSDAAVWPESVKPWDIAAVKLVVEEAGGLLTDLKGHEHKCFDRELTGGLVISNNAAHQDLIDIINQ